jgi:hypothetical protein
MDKIRERRPFSVYGGTLVKRSRISWLECLIAKMRTVLGDAEIADPHDEAKALKLYCKQPDDNEAQWVSVA